MEQLASAELKFAHPLQPAHLRNCVCPYCGALLANVQETDYDHVIGRRFVPRGSLQGAWNLIVRCCRICNNRKSELEDDVSAITMRPDCFGRYPCDDPRLINTADRKTKGSVSRRTGRAVGLSREAFEVSTVMGALSATFTFTGPPQLDDERAHALATYHLKAFFYWVTYKKHEERGWWWPGGYFPIAHIHRGDWGNAVARAFMNHVVHWEPRVIGVTADGYFRIAVRRAPDSELWSYALEWNRNARVIGFLGDGQKALAIFNAFPSLDVRTIAEAPERSIHYRQDIPLDEIEDQMFVWESFNYGALADEATLVC